MDVADEAILVQERLASWGESARGRQYAMRVRRQAARHPPGAVAILTRAAPTVTVITPVHGQSPA